MNLIGKKFGRLQVIEKSRAVNNKTMWKCLCEYRTSK